MFAADLEALGHAVDFGIDFGVGDFDIAVAAVVHDQPLVDEAFEHVFAESLDTGGGQGIALDILAVDDGHHIMSSPFRSAVSRQLFVRPLSQVVRSLLGSLLDRLVLRLTLMKRDRDLRVGRGAAHQQAQQNTDANNGQSTAEQNKLSLPIELLRGLGNDFRTSFLAGHGDYSITVGYCANAA